MNALIAWLLDGEPWVRYNTLIHILGRPESDGDVRTSRADMKSHPLIRGLIRDVSRWPGGILKSHRDSSLTIHKLSFLADIGLTMNDLKLAGVAGKISSCLSADGIPEVKSLIPVHFGGTGKASDSWMLCDAPLVMASCLKMKMKIPERAIRKLVSLAGDNGWPCAGSPSIGKFRGPGRRGDSCPYATLLMLKMAAQMPGPIATREIGTGIESLLSLWQNRKKKKPYLFGMGTDFLKLKAPLIWYDILHVTDTLSRFSAARRDARFREMISVLKKKMDSDGRLIPESVWMSWKEWDFGQKKFPSRWLTFRVLLTLKQADS